MVSKLLYTFYYLFIYLFIHSFIYLSIYLRKRKIFRNLHKFTLLILSFNQQGKAVEARRAQCGGRGSNPLCAKSEIVLSYLFLLLLFWEKRSVTKIKL